MGTANRSTPLPRVLPTCSRHVDVSPSSLKPQIKLLDPPKQQYARVNRRQTPPLPPPGYGGSRVPQKLVILRATRARRRAARRGDRGMELPRPHPPRLCYGSSPRHHRVCDQPKITPFGGGWVPQWSDCAVGHVVRTRPHRCRDIRSVGGCRGSRGGGGRGRRGGGGERRGSCDACCAREARVGGRGVSHLSGAGADVATWGVGERRGSSGGVGCLGSLFG